MGNEMSSLHQAAAKNEVGRIRGLITEHRQDPNSADKDGWVPLHFAAYNGSTAAARELLGRGALVNSTDKGGRTPLHLASLKGQLAVLQQLILSGADVSAADSNRLTALHHAALGGSAEACKALCAAGAQVNAEVEDGSNPIHLASWKGHHEVIKALIPLGGDYKKARKDGNTPLHEAAQCGDEKLIIALMRLGADRFSRNQDGKTPAEIAAEYENEAAAQLITRGPPPKGSKDASAASTMPAAAAGGHAKPSAPPLPAEFAQHAGRVQYPTLATAQKGAKQPDWWTDNIGREVQQSAPAPAPQPGSRQEFENNLGRQFQGAIGNIAKGFGALQQGMLGGGGNQNRDQNQGQQAAVKPQAKVQDDEWHPAPRDDEWGSTKAPTRTKKPATGQAVQAPTQEKYNLEPYDSDDYSDSLGPPKDTGAKGGRRASPAELQRRLAELELGVDDAQGWKRGGQSKSARQKQQEEVARIQAQLDSYKISGYGHGGQSNQGNGQQVPAEYICPITQEVMKEPVMAADGYTYERAAITEWLKTGHTVSPIANEPLSHPGLTSNHGLRKAIQKWQSGH